MRSAVSYQVEEYSKRLFGQPHIPFLAFLSLYKHSEGVRANIARFAPDSFRKMFIEDETDRVRLIVARYADAEELRAEFKDDESKWVRSAVATHATTESLRKRLITDEEELVRIAVAETTKSEVVRMILSDDKAIEVILAIARRSTGLPLQQKLAGHPRASVHRALAQNPNIDKFLLEKLLADSSIEVG